MIKNYLKISFIIVGFCFGILKAQAQSEARIAQQYIKASQYDKAIVLLEDLYKGNKSESYFNSLFKCYFAIKDYSEATKLNKKHLKLKKNNPIPYFNLGLIEEEKGNSEKADSYFEKSKETALKNRNSINKMTALFEDYNRIEDALDLYVGADSKQPNLSYKFKIAEYYGRLNRNEEMIDVYLGEIQRLPKRAYQIKSRMLRSFGQDEDKMDLLRVQLIKKMQKESKAVKALDELLIWTYLQKKNFEKAFKQEVSLNKKHQLNGFRFMDFAKICISNEEYELAHQSLDIVMAYGIDHPNYMNALEKDLSISLIALSQSDTKEESIASLKADFINYFTNYPANSTNLLVQKDYAEFVSFYLEDNDKAIRVLKEAIEYKGSVNETAECKLYLADLLLQKSQLWDALLYYNQIDKSFQHGVLGHEARFRKAKVSFYQGEFRWSKDQLDVLKQSTSKLIANNAMELSLTIQESLNLDSNTFGLEMLARADLYRFQKRYNKAAEILLSLIDLSTNDLLLDDAYLMLSELKNAEKDFTKQEEYLLKIISDYPGILEDNALFNLGLMYEKNIGDTEKASQYYQQLLTDYPSSYWSSQARVNYRQLNSTL